MRDLEDEVILRLQAAAGPPPPGTVGIGDDAAVRPDGTVYTVDTLVEGTHWDHRLDPADVGWKLVATNASDLAAMGARPRWCLLAATLPAPVDLAWVDAFAAGLGDACRRYGLALIGGDTTRGPARVLSLTAAGHALRPIRRAGARPGDDLWVTGTLGLAAEGFLSPAPRPAALARLRRPEPPVAFGPALAEAGLPTAMMDLSDGLRRDLARLCAASGVGAVVEPGALPGDGPLAWRVGFGEDYELLFTAPPAARNAVQSLATMHRTPVSRVGTVTAEGPPRLAGVPDWPDPLFQHFAGGEAP